MTRHIKDAVHDRGFATLEAAGVLLIIMVVTMYGAAKYNDYLDEKNWQLDALRITTWTGAARQYIGKQYAEIVKKKPSAGAPYCVTTQVLKTEGLLPDAFAGKSPEGQTLKACVVTLKNDAPRLEGVVVSEGGVALSLKAMLLIARDIRQGYGGYIEKAGTAIGAQKAWSVALSRYGIQNTQAGHMAVLLSADDLTAAQSSSREDADRLYRYGIPNRPELNAMKTHIDMSGNNLENAGKVNAVTGNFSGNVNATGSVNGQDGNFKGNMTANGDVSGQRGLFSDRLSTSEYLHLGGIAQAGQSCYPNGLVGRDNKGAILSCQDGKWNTAGKIGSITRSATNGLTLTSPDTFEYVNVSIASKFNPRDGSHTSQALFQVYINGRAIAQIQNTMSVRKGGSKGHYWGYQTSAVQKKMYRYSVKKGDTIQVVLTSSNLHASSDIEVTLSN